MALPPIKPKPDASFSVMRANGFYQQAWFEYYASLDNLIHSAPIAVGTPTNANAKAAGVPLGGLYCDTNDPAKVYIRTV